LSLVAPSWTGWQPVAGAYTFYFADLATNALLGVLPLTEVSFDLLLNQSSTFQAKLPLADRRLVPDPDEAVSWTEPRESVVYVDRGGIIVAHASILTRSYDLATDTLTLGGQDLWYWFGRYCVRSDLAFNEDMLKIQRDLVAHAQAQSGANLGIATDDSVNSGVVLVRNYAAITGTQAAGSGTSDSGNIATACANLASLNPGFEFKIRARWDGSVPKRELIQAYPRFGVAASDTNYVWSYPQGAITSMRWPEDGTGAADQVVAMGNQQADGTRPYATSAAAVGAPGAVDVLTFSVDDTPTLQMLADAVQRVRAGNIEIPEVTVFGAVDPAFGSYSVGDHARYHIRAGVRGRFYSGMDSVWRIIGLRVAVRPDGREDVTHLLSPAVA
jgi:hypothetical protein